MRNPEEYSTLFFYISKQDFDLYEIGKKIHDKLVSALTHNGLEFKPELIDEHDPDWIIPVVLNSNSYTIMFTVYSGCSPSPCSISVSSDYVMRNGDDMGIVFIKSLIESTVKDLDGTYGIEWFKRKDISWHKKLDNNCGNLSPKILKSEWGKIELESEKGVKDVKCFPGGCRIWDWSETGTRHVPGIQVADVEELINHGSEVIILSTGFHEKLNVMESTKDYLRNRNVEFFILKTDEAIKLYNNMVSNKKVGALIHSTC